jgi:glutamine amidotransferase
MVHPIIDEYYNYNPYHSRSSKFVQDKGLVTNEKGNSLSRSPAVTPGLTSNDHKRLSPSNLHDSIASTLTPSMHLVSPPPDPDHRHLSTVSNLPVREAKPQELGNTKKKRTSLAGAENIPVSRELAHLAQEDIEVRATAYGDPMKIAQYFPELN